MSTPSQRAATVSQRPMHLPAARGQISAALILALTHDIVGDDDVKRLGRHATR